MNWRASTTFGRSAPMEKMQEVAIHMVGKRLTYRDLVYGRGAARYPAVPYA